MAVTRIWPIKSGELGKVIDYVANTSKTDEHSFSEEQMRDLYNALHYVEDAGKTFDTTEKKLLVSGVNCIPENAKQEMTDTKKRFGKEGESSRTTHINPSSRERSPRSLRIRSVLKQRRKCGAINMK